VKIKSTIPSLGITSDSNMDKGIEKVKEIEYMRLLDAPNVKTVQNATDDEFGSDVDSDFGLDHNAIQHLTGDIVDSMFGIDGNPIMDIKRTPRTKKKACSSRKGKTRNKSKNKR
jgi:hypothetical protein